MLTADVGPSIEKYFCKRLPRPLTATWLKQPNIQEQDQNTCRPMIQQQPEGVDNAQALMLLPFEIMRQQLEAVMFRQLEAATKIYTRQAEELDNAFMTHINKFEMTVKRFPYVRQ